MHRLSPPLTLLATLAGGALVDHLVSALVALLVTVLGQLLLRALMPVADASGRLLVRATGRWLAVRPAATPHDAAERSTTPQSAPATPPAA